MCLFWIKVTIEIHGICTTNAGAVIVDIGGEYRPASHVTDLMVLISNNYSNTT